ncbi:MAG: NUDIX domain-containing protein [Actinobacteria bacterium]|nr:NUDIX domain-containing protein [Actinomycetota bacterium]
MVTPRDAATVMLVRDMPDLHVFMLRRSLNADFVGGAHVFPGGGVDADDRLAEIEARAPGRSDADASRLLGVPSGGLGFWVAAIRESFEEAGVLMARPRASGGPVDLADPEAAARFARARDALNARRLRFVDFLADEDLVLDVTSLHVFSHWITPAGMPRRYDTWFFVAEAPEGHAYLHDDFETIESAWIRPADAIARSRRGEVELIFPTFKNLEALTRFDTAAGLVEYARDATDVAATQPRIVRDASGTRLLLPGDDGYDDATDPADGSVDPRQIADALTSAPRESTG